MKVLRKIKQVVIASLIILTAVLLISGVQWIIRENNSVTFTVEIGDDKPVGIDTSGMTEDEINALMQGGDLDGSEE